MRNFRFSLATIQIHSFFQKIFFTFLFEIIELCYSSKKQHYAGFIIKENRIGKIRKKKEKRKRKLIFINKNSSTT